jgi:hypothetical protein
MTKLGPLLALAFLVAVLLPVGTNSLIGGSQSPATESEAREVVAEFFRTLNSRRYEETCALLADGYFARRPGSSRRICAIGLRASLMWSQETRWRVTDVTTERDLIVVRTVANGAPGSLVLERVGGLLRVLDVLDG